MKYCTFIFIFSMLSKSTFAQKEADNWCFSINRLYFGDTTVNNYFSPTISFGTSNSTLHNAFSSTTMSDRFGNLLFFGGSRGIMRDSTSFMHNGLDLEWAGFGHFQNALTVPEPGSNYRYRYFTITYQLYPPSPFMMHTIDMNALNGSGSVVTKNQPVPVPSGANPGNITAIRHANGRDFWIITYNSNPTAPSILAYLLTDQGINSTPVVSPAFRPLTRAASMKANLQGTKFCVMSNIRPLTTPLLIGSTDSSFIELYDFNKNTGVFSNRVQLDSTFAILNVNGIWQFRNSFSAHEFSPNGRYLYYTFTSYPSNNNIVSINDYWCYLYQFDLDTFFNHQVVQKVVLDSFQIERAPSCLQINNQGKILMSHYASTWPWMPDLDIGVIHHPDSVGVACSFVDRAIQPTTPPGNGGYFPNFFPAFHGPNVWIDAPIRQICKGDSVTLTAKNDTLVWWAASPLYNDTISTDSVIRVAPLITTTYVVHGSNGSAFSVTIDVVDPNADILPMDTFYCAGGSVTLSVSLPLVRQWLWSTGDTLPSIVFADTGWVSVWWRTEVCEGRDSIYVFRQPNPRPNLGPDTTLCDQTAWVLDAGFHGGTYRWSPGNDSTQTKTITELGTYRVQVTDSLGCRGADTIRILQGTLNVSLGQDTVICPREPLLLLGNPPGKRYNWSTGATTDSIRFLGPGLVQLIAQDGFCTGSAAKRVNHLPAPPLEIEADTSNPCTQQPITVRSLHGAVQWFTGISDTSITIQPPAWVWAQVQDSCYTLRDSLFVEGGAEPLFPNVITPNGDGQNDRLSFIEVVEGEYSLEVYNRWGRRVWQSEDATEGWEAQEVPAGTYYYSLRYRDCAGRSQDYRGWVQVLK